MSTPEYREGKLQEEINRLARLCEAKDAEIKGIMRASHSLREGLEEKLSEAQAQIAMQAEVLTAAQIAFTDVSDDDEVDNAVQTISKAISATAETVAAWRAKETEPLRREVAMLRDAIRRVTEANYERSRYAVTLICQEALNDTQATTLAYEREVENRGAVKALEDFRTHISNRGLDWSWCLDCEIEAYVEELRAANKGE